MKKILLLIAVPLALHVPDALAQSTSQGGDVSSRAGPQDSPPQTTTQVVAPGSTVTTTIASPTGTVTKITTTSGKSVMTRFRDGTPIEMDSDGSVHIVYPDGARVAAPDGIHPLIDGSSITIKDGKRIP